MVSVRRMGRLGNELYQYAAAIGYAEKHGLEFSFPRKTHDTYWAPASLPHLFNEKWVEGREDVLINEDWNHEKQYTEIPFSENWRNSQIVLNGYWQSWRYWDFCRDKIISTFNFPWQQYDGLISIHVRRGDYLLHPTKHPVVTIEYLMQAIDIFRMKGYRRFKFYSDDLAWCTTCGIPLYFPDCEFEFSTGKTSFQNMIDMSCCESHIVSNSTMSVWAAELNRNERKVVVIPSEQNWFGPDNNLTVKDLYRDWWIQIKY